AIGPTGRGRARRNRSAGWVRDLNTVREEAAVAKDHGPSVKDDKQYEGLKKKGMSKERAAKIANTSNASEKGGKRSGSGKGSSQSSQSSGSGSGGNRSQKQAAGRKGGKKSS